MMLSLYAILTRALGFLFDLALFIRLKKGRVDGVRLPEYRGRVALARPDGTLIWVHGASVGEAQSALKLVEDILAQFSGAHVLVTTGTLTSARLMARHLPDRAFHQFYPLDRPDWVAAFLDHWQPDAALWMESEIWPNMLQALDQRSVPRFLLNGRLSARSASRWRRFAAGAAARLIGGYAHIFAQTQRDVQAFQALGGRRNITLSGNIKYSAADLPCDDQALAAFNAALSERPVWLYASTHAGEEALACAVHKVLKIALPDVLTVLVPRHPERGAAIVEECRAAGVQVCLRDTGGEALHLPESQDDVYVANTLGELGLFYRAAPVAVIGRSFSLDGGGGHNPIEAAQLGAAVLSGAHVRYQQDIFDEMSAAGAAHIVQKPVDLAGAVLALLQDREARLALQARGQDFVRTKQQILENVETALFPMLGVRAGEEEGAHAA